MQTGFYIVFAWCWQKRSSNECQMDVKMFLCVWACVLIDVYVWVCVSLNDGRAAYCTLITMLTGGGRALQKLWFSLFIINKMECFSLFYLSAYFFISASSSHYMIFISSLLSPLLYLFPQPHRDKEFFVVVVVFCISSTVFQSFATFSTGLRIELFVCLIVCLFVWIPEFELKWTIQTCLILIFIFK